jgi:hypothetical protein
LVEGRRGGALSSCLSNLGSQVGTAQVSLWPGAVTRGEEIHMTQQTHVFRSWQRNMNYITFQLSREALSIKSRPIHCNIALGGAGWIRLYPLFATLRLHRSLPSSSKSESRLFHQFRSSSGSQPRSSFSSPSNSPCSSPRSAGK